MKLAIIADIHDNEQRLNEALSICQKEKIKACVCCGDISRFEIITTLSKAFQKTYIALGNMDFVLKNQLQAFPENVIVSSDVLETKIDGLSAAVVHHDYKARELAKENRYNVVFYGHTHTPWEKKTGKTLLLNPGEISGQFGVASFAIFDTKTKGAELKLLT